MITWGVLGAQTPKAEYDRGIEALADCLQAANRAVIATVSGGALCAMAIHGLELYQQTKSESPQN